ncbi:MAG: FxsA family protein [Actinomycetota bacterium]
MTGLLALAFLVMPILEIYVVTQVADGVGWLNTIALVILVSLGGALLVRIQGITVLARIQRRLQSGEVPGRELVDGALILVAGALLLTPGFLTDGVGLFFLLPPTRAIARAWLTRRYAGRIQAGTVGQGGGFGTRFYGTWNVVDTDLADDDRPSGPGGPSGPDRPSGPDELGPRA